MTREELKKYISETYSVLPETPWKSRPSCEAFRCPEGQQYFALLEDIPVSRLAEGPASSGSSGKKKRKDPGPFTTLLTLMSDPALAGSLLREPGFHPAFRMKKEGWISLETAVVSEKMIMQLLDMSFDAMTVKKKTRKYPEDFFIELIGEPISDRRYADCLIGELLDPRYKGRYDRHYTVFRTYFVEGRTMTDTGKVLGGSYGMARSLKLTGIYALRRLYYKAEKPSTFEDYQKNISLFRRREEAYEAETAVCSAGPVFPDSLLETLGLPDRIFVSLRYDKHISTVEEFLALSDLDHILWVGKKDIEKIRALQEDVRKRLRERTKEERERRILAVQYREDTFYSCPYSERPLYPTSPVYYLPFDGFDILNKLSLNGIHTAGKLLRLKGTEKFPGFSDQDWEIIRSCQKIARERMIDDPFL